MKAVHDYRLPFKTKEKVKQLTGEARAVSIQDTAHGTRVRHRRDARLDAEGFSNTDRQVSQQRAHSVGSAAAERRSPPRSAPRRRLQVRMLYVGRLQTAHGTRVTHRRDARCLGKFGTVPSKGSLVAIARVVVGLFLKGVHVSHHARGRFDEDTVDTDELAKGRRAYSVWR